MKTITKTKTIGSFLIAFIILAGVQQQAKGMSNIKTQRAGKHKSARELFKYLVTEKDKSKINFWILEMDPAYFFVESAFKEDFGTKYKLLQMVDVITGKYVPLQWFTKKGYAEFNKVFKKHFGLTVKEYEDKWEDERQRLIESAKPWDYDK